MVTNALRRGIIESADEVFFLADHDKARNLVNELNRFLRQRGHPHSIFQKPSAPLREPEREDGVWMKSALVKVGIDIDSLVENPATVDFLNNNADELAKIQSRVQTGHERPMWG